MDSWRRRRDSNPRYPYGVYTISNRARSTGLRDFSIAVKLKTIQFSLSTIANARGKVKSDFAAREDFFAGSSNISDNRPFCGAASGKRKASQSGKVLPVKREIMIDFQYIYIYI